MTLLKKCCCSCLSLKHGAIVIGVSSLMSGILFCFFLPSLQSLKNNLENGKVFSSIYLFNTEFLVIGGFVFFLLSASSLFLLIGAKKGYKAFLLPWIISFSFFIISFTAYMTVVMVKLTGLILGGIMFILAILFLSSLAFQVYLLAVVVSLFQELNQQEAVKGNKPGEIFSGPNYWSPRGIFILPYTLGSEAA